MKRVLKGFTNKCNLDCSNPPLFEDGMHQFHLNLIDKPEEDGWDIPVRITVEDLPESKPEPEKKCGNCGAYKTTGCPGDIDNCESISIETERAFYKNNRPKAAEPQESWQTRILNKGAELTGMDLSCMIVHIRAEIERAVSKERQAWEAQLPLVPDAEDLERLHKESKAQEGA